MKTSIAVFNAISTGFFTYKSKCQYIANSTCNSILQNNIGKCPFLLIGKKVRESCFESAFKGSSTNSLHSIYKKKKTPSVFIGIRLYNKWKADAEKAACTSD